MGIFAAVCLGYCIVVLIALVHSVRGAIAVGAIYTFFMIWQRRQGVDVVETDDVSPRAVDEVDTDTAMGLPVPGRTEQSDASDTGFAAIAVTARPGRDGLPRAGYIVFSIDGDGDMHAFVDALSGGIPYLRSVFPGIPVLDTITITAAQFNELRDWSDGSVPEHDGLPF